MWDEACAFQLSEPLSDWIEVVVFAHNKAQHFFFFVFFVWRKSDREREGEGSRDLLICFPGLCLQDPTFQTRCQLWGALGRLTKITQETASSHGERGSDCVCSCQPACFRARVYITIILLAHLYVFCPRACVQTAQI